MRESKFVFPKKVYNTTMYEAANTPKVLSTGVEIPAGGVPTWDGRMQFTTRAEKRPESIDDEATYLKWKWRINLANPATGLDNDALIAGVKTIVAESGWAGGTEDWFDVAARCFDFLVDNVGAFLRARGELVSSVVHGNAVLRDLNPRRKHFGQGDAPLEPFGGLFSRWSGILFHGSVFPCGSFRAFKISRLRSQNARTRPCGLPPMRMAATVAGSMSAGIRTRRFSHVSVGVT